LEAFIQGVVTKHGKIHTVVNASGSNIAMRFIGDVDSEEWRRVMDEDVNGCY
jgi:NADP-dependent 3-hydroxy acid dehydrogenase YdfG